MTIHFDNNEDRFEAIGTIIDVFDDFLNERHIKLSESEKAKLADGVSDEPTVIYGDDYFELEDNLKKLFSFYEAD